MAQDIRILRIKCLDLEREVAVFKKSGNNSEDFKVTMSVL